MKTLRSLFSVTILPILLLALQNCDNDLSELEKLPKATQNGEEIFGCLVNGKAEKAIGISKVSSYYQTGTMSMHAGLGNSLIQITVHDLNLSESTYPLTERVFEGKYARYYDGDCDCYTTTNYVGSIIITHLDQVNFIISGTFEFEAYSASCAKVIKVTNGRFDIHYAP